METLCYIFLSFFALCGICYLARDGYRVWQGHRLCGIHFAVVCRAADFGNKRERDCALLLLSSFLSRPEAKHLVREVVLTDTAPQEICGAAENFDIPLLALTREEFIRLL